jgi:hypothetical protein
MNPPTANVLPLSRGNRTRQSTALGTTAARLPSAAAAELDGGPVRVTLEVELEPRVAKTTQLAGFHQHVSGVLYVIWRLRAEPLYARFQIHDSFIHSGAILTWVLDADDARRWEKDVFRRALIAGLRKRASKEQLYPQPAIEVPGRPKRRFHEHLIVETTELSLADFALELSAPARLTKTLMAAVRCLEDVRAAGLTRRHLGVLIFRRLTACRSPAQTASAQC